MKLTILALAAGIAAVPRLALSAEPDVKALRLVPKEAFTKSIAPSPHAPFSLKVEHAPGLDLAQHPQDRRRVAPSSCETQHALCYDSTSGRIVYKPARALMPDIPGFQRENISIKRDRIIFRYTF